MSREALIVLFAIPTVSWALFADHFRRYLDRLAARQPKFDRTLELRRARFVGFLVLCANVVIWLASRATSEHTLLASALFIAAWVAQAGIQNGIEKRLIKTESNALVRLHATIRSINWSLAAVFVVLAPSYAFTVLGFIVAASLEIPAAWKIVMILGGALIGIFVGLGLIYGLMPVLIRKTMPCEPLAEGPIRDRILSLFSQSGVTPPDLCILSPLRPGHSNAMVAGFLSGRGIFRPALFITASLLESTTQAERDAVILHEISHLALSHLRKRLAFTLIVIAACMGFVALLVTTSILFLPHALLPVINLLALAGSLIVIFALPRAKAMQQEFEADLHAVTALGAEAGAMISVLERLDSLGLGPGMTHPSTRERIQALRSLTEHSRDQSAA